MNNTGLKQGSFRDFLKRKGIESKLLDVCERFTKIINDLGKHAQFPNILEALTIRDNAMLREKGVNFISFRNLFNEKKLLNYCEKTKVYFLTTECSRAYRGFIGY